MTNRARTPPNVHPEDLPRIVNLALGQNHVLELIANGAPLAGTLDALVRFLEREVPEMLCSILLLDQDGIHLRHGAAPSLPAAYARAIDGARIGPRAGSCGTAAFLNQRVVVADTQTDPLWLDYRDLARQHGLRACWSTPIRREQAVIGTFAMYFADARTPEPIHEQLIGIATHVAAIAIGKELREKAVRDSEERYRLLNLATNDAVWDWDVKRGTLWWNDCTQRLFGYAAGEIGSDLAWWVDRVHPDDRTRVHDSLQHAADAGADRWQEDYRFLRRDGSYADIQDRGHVMRDESGAAVRFIGMMQDVSERRQAALKIEHLAYHEPVTQLPNRAAMERALVAAAAKVDAGGGALSLVLLNLNYFRDVNDSLGHANGDRLLQLVADRLRDTIGDAGLVASLGGDEFAVLIPGPDVPADHDAVLTAFHACLQRPFELVGIPIKLQATGGIAVYPRDGSTPRLLWQHADVALRTAKERRVPHLGFHPDIDHYDSERLSLIGELETAIEAGQLLLHYQPKIDLRSERTVGLEALVRWAHPTRGLVFPDVFMPLAERTDLINPLTRWMVGQALRDGLRLGRQKLSLHTAVNLSARSLHDTDFCESLLALVRELAFPVSRLTFEITETAIVSDPMRARAGLDLFRAAGINLAMDDFGVGQSSLTYLKDLPITTMKIDKSFVMELNALHNAAIVRSAIDMGRNLGLHVTAEGVEQETTYHALRAMGCDGGQGYLFSRPLALTPLCEWLRGARWAPLTSA
jgi:diguanylate cyclase (GGDEF)-like protein/PAS domain S-box-containing protein